jgi:hypothetical protein
VIDAGGAQELELHVAVWKCSRVVALRKIKAGLPRNAVAEGGCIYEKKVQHAFDCQAHGGLRDGKEQMLQFRIDQHPMPACGSSWQPEGNPNMKRDAIRSGGTSAIGEQPITLDVLKEKYLKDGEADAPDIYRRVARALASVEREADRALWEQRFFDNLQAGAIGAGRIMSAAGTAIQATLINCFVQPVGDCIQGVDEGGYPGIYEALREAAETMRLGGGVGYDFSRIRPRGAEVKAMASLASGPCSFPSVEASP